MNGLVWVLFIAAAFAADCRFGKTLVYKNEKFANCSVTGSSDGSRGKTYVADCDGLAKRERQVEIAGDKVTLLSATERKTLAVCGSEHAVLSALIADFEKHRERLENPKCYLTNWKGQMIFVANGVHGRCSFNMNRPLMERFKKSTGEKPMYQCEGDYFLGRAAREGTPVYRKVQDGWKLDCQAQIMSEPVGEIDWKFPPSYYTPDEPTVTPDP
jgi:hypothetical protein